MCGIVGVCGDCTNKSNIVKKMADTLVYRGPNAEGFWLEDSEKVALGHRRLSILDLSDAGAQPMQSKSSRYVLSYNGEIYNYRDIAEQLKARHALGILHGCSDTEIILAAFDYWGIEKSLDFLIGAFAMAVYDREQEVLFLIRDRMGEKPLYYFAGSGKLIFASDMNAMKAACVPLSIDEQGLGLFFTYGYIPAPYSIYKEISKLPGGHLLKYSLKIDKIELTSYWDIEEIAYRGHCNPFNGSIEEAKDELKSILERAIRRQMISDVPLGAFLSGGIDSSLVVSLMQNQLLSGQIKTFSIGFDEKDYNEAPYAKKIAEYLGAKHTELYLKKADIIDTIVQMPQIYGEPFADSSEIPTYLVSKLAKESVTVALSGDGGDEVFCGYPHYDLLFNRWKKIKKLPYIIRQYTGKVLTEQFNYNDRIYRIGNQMKAKTIEDLMLRFPIKTGEYIQCRKQQNMIVPTIPSRGILYNDKEKMMLIDQMYFLPDDILAKVDRASMSVSLESRIPLLDKEVVEFAWRLPTDFKSFNGISKYILKELLYENIPKEFFNRPKSGFCLPLKTWLQNGELHDWANETMRSSKIRNCDFINYNILIKLWDTFQNKGIFYDVLWSILMFNSWYLEN